MSHHDVAHHHLQTNFTTKYELPTPETFEILLEQDFNDQGYYSKVKGQIKATL